VLYVAPVLIVGFLCVFPVFLSASCSCVFWCIFGKDLGSNFFVAPLEHLLVFVVLLGLEFKQGCFMWDVNSLLCFVWSSVVVGSGPSCIRFCQCFGRDFESFVRPLPWVCCTLSFGVRMGWFLMGWGPPGVFRVGFCQSLFRVTRVSGFVKILVGILITS